MISPRPASYRWRPSPLLYGPGPVGQAVLLVAVALFLFLFLFASFSAGSPLIGTVALAAPIVAIAVWARPYWAAMALVMGGSIHQFAMLLLLHFTHSDKVVKVAQLWKEAVVLALLALLINQAFKRKAAPRITLLDLLVVMFLLWSGLYLLYPSETAEVGGILPKLFGWRLDTFALLAYFIGRGLALTRKRVRWLLLAFAGMVAVIAVVAAIEFMAPNATNAFFQDLGVRDFGDLLLGDAVGGSIVRFNTIGGVAIPRASSLLLSDLGLAFYMLLGVPLAAAFYFLARNGRQQIGANVLLLLAMASTVLTMTRSAILALGTMLVAMLLACRRGAAFLVLAVEGVLGAGLVAVFLRIPPSLIQGMFSTNEGSFKAHIQALQISLDILRQSPMGLGLGSAGPVSQKFALTGGITNESWYFQIATEMGVAGMLLWMAVLLTFGVLALRRYGEVRDPWLKALCLTMAGATVGFAEVSLTLHAWSSLTTSIIFWLLAGAVANAKQIDSTGASDLT